MIRMLSRIAFLVGCGIAAATVAQAQTGDKLTLSGSVQSDMLIPQSDKDIGADKMDDAETEALSGEIATKIQNEMTYPGQVKITVIRETRSVAYAK